IPSSPGRSAAMRRPSGSPAPHATRFVSTRPGKGARTCSTWAESPRVRACGSMGRTWALFARPFRVETGPLRRTGNELEIEVTNLSANRIRDLDVRRVPWKVFEDINFVGIDYKPFDASGWPLKPSGLFGPVHLEPLASQHR